MTRGLRPEALLLLRALHHGGQQPLPDQRVRPLVACSTPPPGAAPRQLNSLAAVFVPGLLDTALRARSRGVDHLQDLAARADDLEEDIRMVTGISGARKVVVDGMLVKDGTSQNTQGQESWSYY